MDHKGSNSESDKNVLDINTSSTNELESLLNIFSNNQVKIGANGAFEFQGSDIILTTVGIEATAENEAKPLINSCSNITETLEDHVKTPQAADLSLNSSGYVSNGSPDSLSSSSSSIHISPNITLSFESPQGQGNGIDLSKIVDFSLPTEAESQHEGDPIGHHQPTNINVSVVSSAPPANDHGQQPRVQSPDWLRQVYPELYTLWYQTSASEFYQGGVKMLCSSCKRAPAAGFHEGLPMCDQCKNGRPCTVCRIRTVSSFSFGLALCEADKVFLYRCFTNRSVFPRCSTYCPVTVQRWCNYCRLKSCLTAKGFRFYYEQEPGGKKRSSSDVGLSESNAKVQTIANISRGQANVNQPKDQALQYQAAASQPSSPFLHPGNISRQSPRVDKPTIPQTVTRSRETVIKQSRPYDGARLGERSKRGPGSGLGFNNDHTKLTWVAQQQEKYLQYHLSLYRERLKLRK